MAQINPLISRLAGTCLGGVLYGIFFILFLLSMALLINRSRTTNPRSSIFSLMFSPMIFGSSCMFITITSHFVIMAYRLVAAVESPEGPFRYYLDWSKTSMVVFMAMFFASAILGDAIIIYRLWVVWSYNRLVVLFPLAALAGLIAAGGGLTYQFTKLKLGDDIFNSGAGRWVTCDCVFTLCVNVYCSSLIAYRIWSVNSESRKAYASSSLNSVLAIIIESALFYTAWTIVFFVTYLARQYVSFFIVDAWPPISGITCMMINVRAGLGWAQEATGLPNETSRVVFDKKLSGTDNQFSVGQTSGAGSGNTLYVMQAMGTTTTASKETEDAIFDGHRSQAITINMQRAVDDKA